MESIQNVLKKAKEEGKIDPGMLPWDTSISDTSNRKTHKVEKKVGQSFRPLPLGLSEEYLNDIERVVENIHLIAKEKTLQVIGITSAVPNQGTSTLAAIVPLLTARQASEYVDVSSNVEVQSDKDKSFSNRKNGVILIDVQFRHPSLHEIFQEKQEPGLVELLSDVSLLDRVIRDVPHSNLRLITLGRQGEVPLTHKDLEKLKVVVNSLRAKCEFVFLDIPPILHFAEGITLSKLCDGVIIVVRAGRARWEVVEEAKRLLEYASVNILGGVLNRREFVIPERLYKLL